MLCTKAVCRTVSRPALGMRRTATLMALAAANPIVGTQIATAQTSIDPVLATEAGATDQPSKWEFLIDSGVLFPTGAQRDRIKQANLAAAQLSWVVRPDLAVTGTIGWARARDIATVGNPRLDIFTYDIGAEFRALHWLAGRTAIFSPFTGIGVGGRTYSYHSLAVGATHNVAGFISAGGEFGIRRVRLRFEVRDYVSGFQPLNGSGSSGARNDVVALIGLRIAHRKP